MDTTTLAQFRLMMLTSPPYSIYLHIPFCRHICSYCAFNTYAGIEAQIPAFIQALKHEISYLGGENPQLPVHTLYFGGGTPSLIAVEEYAMLFKALKNAFDIAEGAEISLEANPNDLSLSYLEGLLQVGFNRLSIGMQSAHEGELRLFERRHDLAMTVQAVQDARQAGFENISLDLIFGLPEQTAAHWQSTLETTLVLRPEHISLYGLEFKDGTKLTKQVAQGILPAPDEDVVADMYDMATEMLGAAGFEQYEISNWCQPSRESRHNLQYWHMHPYLGLGPGAHGYADEVRTIALRSPQRYIEVMERGERRGAFPRTPATSRAHKVSHNEAMSNAIMMGMRLTKTGIDRKLFERRFGVDFYTLHQNTLDRFAAHGVVEILPERVRLTQRGRFISNVVLRELI